MAKTEYWVWLSNALGPGSGAVDKVIEAFETPEYLYAEKKNGFEAVGFLTARERGRLMAASLSDALRMCERTLDKGFCILTPEDRDYPDRLQSIYARPAVLYVDGDLGDIDNEAAVAVVGTRNYSDYGFRAASKIAFELAKAGAVVVSGMAKGIDTVAHKAALKAEGKTIAVLGCGLDVPYPRENAALMEVIAHNGAVVSEFPLGAEPVGFHFPIRNRIISGLSMGVTVVEADLKSGSLITANLALEQGRDVFAVPNDIFNDNSRGTFRLLRLGAIPVASAADILEEYRYRFSDRINIDEIATEVEKKEQNVFVREKKLLQGATPEMQEVYDVLTEIPANLDEIALKTGKNTQEVLTALSELEIMGFVSASAGRRYSIR
ncbi:MAG: DNA-processing protein DprA [Oscillospiraceae bacterium]|nr:DNA-processing protein DprA [Oscillospiraceae bacterium]